MAIIYASTDVADGTTGAGTVGDPTSIRDAMSSAVAGDQVAVLEGENPWTLNTVTGPLTTAAAGTATDPIEVIGYSTVPLAENGMPEIVVNDPSNTNAIEVGHDFWHFRNFRITGARRGIDTVANSYGGFSATNIIGDGCGSHVIFLRAETLDSNILTGIVALGGCTTAAIEVDGRSSHLIDCWALGVTGDGFRVAGSNYGSQVFNCVAHACGGAGFRSQSTMLAMTHCVANRCTGAGLQISTDNAYVKLRACGFSRNNSDSFQIVADQANTPVYADHCAADTGGGSDTVNANVELLGSPGIITTGPDFVDGSPADPLDADLRLGASTTWRDAGPRVANFTQAMNVAQDIGLVFPSEAPSVVVVQPVVIVPQFVSTS